MYILIKITCESLAVDHVQVHHSQTKYLHTHTHNSVSHVDVQEMREGSIATYIKEKKTCAKDQIYYSHGMSFFE